MLNFLRTFMHSRLGVLIALGFLVLIALAFAAGDVAGMRQSLTPGGGDRVATVGGRKIDGTELAQAATNALEQVKRDDPRLTMRAFIAGGGLAGALDQTIDRVALSEYGRKYGLVASDRLVDSEIAKIPAFQGPDGKFSDSAYRALLAQRGLSDAGVRSDLASGLIARQLLVPAAFGARMPGGLVIRYATLLAERRNGAIALLPAAAFAPATAPSEAELASFYAANRTRYVRPERRTIRYAVFDDSALKSVPAPTEAEIAARYNANRAAYAASESRKLSQLILPTEAAAQAVLAEVRGGKTLEAAAAAKGLAVAALGPFDRAGLTAQAGEAAAAAGFATARGQLAGPVRTPLGWALVRVDAIEAKPARSLDQVRGEISTELAAQKRRAALTDFSAKVEDEFDNGSALGDVARELTIAITETPPLTADGQVYGAPGQPAPAELTRVLATAFAMEREGQPQLAEVEPGKKFIVFDVSRIAPAAAAPLLEIKAQVTADLQLQKGAAAARAAAEKVLAQARKGGDLASLVPALGVAQVPPVDRVELNRTELARQGQAVPPPLALLFSMAQGTVKLLAAPGNRGWYIVSLARIVPGDAAGIAPLLPQASRELSGLAGREYAEQLRAAIRQDLGVTRNQAGIDAVARRLAGGN